MADRVDACCTSTVHCASLDNSGLESDHHGVLPAVLQYAQSDHDVCEARVGTFKDCLDFGVSNLGKPSK